MSKQIHTYEGMAFVKQEYVSSKMSDTEFAAHATQVLKRPYSLAQVRSYRKALRIENNKSPNLSKTAELEMAKSLLRRVSNGYDPTYFLPSSLIQEIDEFLGELK